ncbi:GNAT family N-acetyltransferase [Oricola sp.]|uniref:GNAT family N-acetyltransferase n=1 Tax=Oricola sp. TaxID=1979950 RepID=UPI0035136C63
MSMSQDSPDHEAKADVADDSFVIRVNEHFSDIEKADWDRLSGTAPGSHPTSYNPFISHAFLSSLEESGSAVAGTGWLGQHLTLEDGEGRIVGALPCYLKSHSKGEYVFDYGWADAWERAGGRYYPKLQCSVPFTPATGPRLLALGTVDVATTRQALAAGLKTLTERLGVSSAHVTFAADADIAAFEKAGFLHRTDQQFHFRNEDYGNFDEFLDSLSSRKRKNIRKERATALQEGLTIDWLTGRDLTESVLDAFFEFYTDTGNRKWGRPYLTREFYSLIAERMPDDILLVMAKGNGRYVAGAINFIGGDRLFGRHWGCIEHHPCLHFEVCYYQAIEFAIERKLEFVEAGAQGEHKLARGYMPVTTHSAHFIPNESFRNAVADYLEHEREDVSRFSELLSEHSPFKKEN